VLTLFYICQVLESFEFLSRPEFTDATQSLANPDGIIEGCRSTVEEISKGLDGLSLTDASHIAPSKRRRIKGALQWVMEESKFRKLLDETMKHKSTITLALLGEITTDVKCIKRKVEDIDDRLDARQRWEIYNWVELTNPTAIHQRACKNHEKNTCQWIHRVEQWNDWLSRKRRMIWLHGIPGAGKTVLASYLIEQTIAHCQHQSSNRVECLYYYCSFTHGQSEQRNETFPFLRWIVSQLCRRSEDIPCAIIDLHRHNNIMSLEVLKEALGKLLEGLDVLYIVLDGVDESSPRDTLLELIQDLATQQIFAKIQLLVTSRRYGDIEAVLRPLADPSLPMSNDIVDEDIRSFVDATMQRDQRFKQWPEALLKDISSALVKGAQGM
jgi:Cdc6-like AAA superfamily ATPase